MGSGSKQPLLVGRSYSMQVQQLCMVLLVMLLVVCFSMIVSVEAAASSSLSSSRKMAAMDQCAQLQHHNIGLLKPRHPAAGHEFKSVVTDWVMELVKPLICYQRQHVVHHHRCYGRQWDFAATAVMQQPGGDSVGAAMSIRAVCIPKTQSLLEKHEGRHECAYNKSDGSRAVGVGYNLDDDPDTRRSEISGVLANYDKVYKGEECLNNFQISALLALDAKRVLDRAANSVASLDDLCCSVMAVFGDIQHSAGSEVFESSEFEEFVGAVSAKKWEKAAKKLKETKWCQKHKHRCEDDRDIIREGCDGSDESIAATISMITADAMGVY
ncbi:unnamed protein product [Sphagnum jensenii]|uniref:Uncharacterized protein n=1 Tax=Sphagnum jensenii TaxID=128206 RepID=A0ABP1AUR1_9BRYO